MLVSLNEARARARDAKRISELEELRKAIEIAKVDGVVLPQIYAYTHSGTFASYFSFLVPDLIPEIPYEVKPISDNTAHLYYYCNTNTQRSGNLCHNDTDPNTWAISFFTETSTALGEAGPYCLTSIGFFPRESGNNGNNKCLQR